MQVFRWMTGASIIALAAAGVGCGGNGDVESTSQRHENGEDGGNGEACECKVTGGGVDFLVGDVRFTFGLNALPREDDDDHGHITLQVHEGGDKFFGRVTDIVSCEITEDGGIVEFTGFLADDGDPDPFTVIVQDLGEPGRDDTIQFEGGGFEFGPIELGQGGNIQVHKPKPGDCPPAT